jgi:hypothetical protein
MSHDPTGSAPTSPEASAFPPNEEVEVARTDFYRTFEDELAKQACPRQLDPTAQSRLAEVFEKSAMDAIRKEPGVYRRHRAWFLGCVRELAREACGGGTPTDHIQGGDIWEAAKTVTGKYAPTCPATNKTRFCDLIG